jgi:DNA-binding NarL/FixJ family response regulator
VVRDPRTMKRTRPRILIADDDPMVRDQIGSMLEAYFDVVARAENGRQLLELVEKHSPSVVVTDITMPEIDGIEATRRISKKFSAVKVVVLSVHDDSAMIEGAFEAGAMGFVSKITAFNELIPAIENVLKGRLYRPRRLK